MVLFGVGVLGQAIYKIMTGSLPIYETMGLIGSLALSANLICFWILYSNREDDINMRSTWVCSRNDIIENVSTLVAAFLVAQFKSLWPDIIVGAVISILFLSSAFMILREAHSELKQLQC